MKELWRSTDASATQEVKQLSDTRLNNKGYVEQSAFNKIKQIVFWLETLKKLNVSSEKKIFCFMLFFFFLVKFL